MSDIGAELSFVGVYVSANLNGIVVTLFIYLLYLGRKRPHAVDWKMLIAAFLLALFPSIFLWNAVRREQLTFIGSQNLQVGNASYSPSDNSGSVLLSASSFGLTVFLSDLIMVWRCLIVWSHRKWVVLFPIFTWLSGSASIFVTVWLNTQSQATYIAGFGWGLAGLAASLATNLMVTSLIVFRILYIRREMRSVLGRHHSTMYISVIAIVVESAALYAIFEIAYLINYTVQSSPAQGLMLYALIQVMAIAPLLMMVRVGLGQSLTETTKTRAATGISFAPRSTLMPSYSVGRSQLSETTYNEDLFEKDSSNIISIGMAA